MRPRRPEPDVTAAVIGAGVGRAHLEALLSEPGCRVAGICDEDPQKRRELQEAFPGLRVTADYRELYDDPSVNLAVIASHDDDHAEQTVEALGGGRHVFVEKPMCLTEDEAVRILRALRNSDGARLSSNLILRKSPRFAELRRAVRAGEYGSVYSAEADYQYGRIEKITRGWRGKIPFYSVFLGGGVHVADLLLWTLGVRAVEVFACGNRIATEGTDFRYNDFVTSIVKLENGAALKLTANFGCVQPHFHRVALHGTRGSFIQDVGGAFRTVSRDPSVAPVPVTEAYPGCGKAELLTDFVRALRSGGEPAVTERDVFDVLSVCFAVESSMNTSRVARVNHLWEGA